MTLREALLGCSTGQLRRIADAWGVPPDPSLLRRELIDLIFERISAGVSEAAFWASLGEVETRLLGRLVRARGHHELALLERRALAALDEAEEGAAGRIDAGVERLTVLGLVFRVFEADGQQRRTALVMPLEILQAVETRLAPVASGMLTQPAPEPANVARCDLSFDLFALASALRREALAADSRALAGRAARTVGQVLGGLESSTGPGPGEPGRRWRFLLWLGKRAGWLAGRGWPVPDDERIERLLGDRRALVQEALAAARAEPSLRERDRRQPNMAGLHDDALQVLSELEPGVWWSVDSVVAHLLAEAGPRGEEASPDADARIVRRADDALRRWLAGRWFWLGIVEWGQSDAGWLLVSRSRGALVAWSASSPAANRSAALCAVVGDFRFAAPSSADLQALYRCERYLAFRGSDGAARRYDLTPASVARGLRLGGDDLELQALLKRLLASDLPPDWIEAIGRWAHPTSPLRLEPRVLLVARDPAELDSALEARSARIAIAARLSDRYAVVALEHVADLLAGLAEAGQPVEVDPALRVEPHHPARAAALGDGSVEAAWVALDALRRLAPDLFGQQRDLVTAIAAFEAVLPAARLEVLERRARTIVGLASDRRAARPPSGRRRRLP